jgi:membrane-associated protein
MMEIIGHLAEFILHLDKHLGPIIERAGDWTYLLFFMIIFLETGLVATPFLPGDSLLFALGIFSAAGALKISWLFVLLSIAAILGDSLNYAIGKYIGKFLLDKKKLFFIKDAHIQKTHEFFEKYGPKTIVLARFVPIVRTFAPFVAGIGSMSYRRFFAYNVIGGILWVGAFLYGGFYLGNFSIVKDNFGIVVIMIIVGSILLGLSEFLKKGEK